MTVTTEEIEMWKYIAQMVCAVAVMWILFR
jgi:hypothetical protein